MSSIDYSKWDHMYFSDDEDDHNNKTYKCPRVTKLDTASRITRQCDGTLMIEPISPACGPMENRVVEEHKVEKKNKSSEVTLSSVTPADASAATNQMTGEWTKNGSASIIQNQDEENLVMYWSQDRYDVTIRILIDMKVRGKDVRVSVRGALPYKDRTSAVGIDRNLDRSFTVSIQGKTILQTTIPYPIFLAEEEEEEDINSIFWSIESNSKINNKKILTITFHKAVPMEGVTLWWSRPFQYMDEMDVTKFESRKTNNIKQQQLVNVWNEAHTHFRENISKKKKIEIDTP